MTKVCFAIRVKYNGQEYLPNTPFEVLDRDVPDLKTKGCWVIEEKEPVRLVKENEEVKPAKKTTAKTTKKKEE